MAWVVVPGSNGIWEYDDAATAADSYPDANGTVSGGVRTFTPPGGNSQLTYIRTRKAGETAERGELSKNYYDFRYLSNSFYMINNINNEGANINNFPILGSIELIEETSDGAIFTF